MHLPDSNLPSLPRLRQELADLYGDDVQVFAGRHHARFIPDDVPQHVISRVFQGRHLLRPGKLLNNIIAAVMAKAANLFPKVHIYAYAFLSNHIHAQLKGPSHQVADFVGYLKREITTRWGHRPEVHWRGTMWEEYLSTALPTDESQILCLRYILSHGVKEKLVSKCQLWPGVHAAKQLLTGSTLAGDWFNSTLWTRARDAESRKNNPRPVRKNDYYERYELTLVPIEPWKDLSPEEYRQKIREMADEIEEEGRIAREGRKPLGAKAVMRMPLNHKSQLPPQPWFEDRQRMICWADPRSPQTKAYLDRYWDFQAEFRRASARLLAGKLDVEFPPGAFRPVTRSEAATP